MLRANATYYAINLSINRKETMKLENKSFMKFGVTSRSVNFLLKNPPRSYLHRKSKFHEIIYLIIFSFQKEGLML